MIHTLIRSSIKWNCEHKFHHSSKISHTFKFEIFSLSRLVFSCLFLSQSQQMEEINVTSRRSTHVCWKRMNQSDKKYRHKKRKQRNETKEKHFENNNCINLTLKWTQCNIACTRTGIDRAVGVMCSTIAGLMTITMHGNVMSKQKWLVKSVFVRVAAHLDEKISSSVYNKLVFFPSFSSLYSEFCLRFPFSLSFFSLKYISITNSRSIALCLPAYFCVIKRCVHHLCRTIAKKIERIKGWTVQEHWAQNCILWMRSKPMWTTDNIQLVELIYA